MSQSGHVHMHMSSTLASRERGESGGFETNCCQLDEMCHMGGLSCDVSYAARPITRIYFSCFHQVSFLFFFRVLKCFHSQTGSTHIYARCSCTGAYSISRIYMFLFRYSIQRHLFVRTHVCNYMRIDQPQNICTAVSCMFMS